MLVGLLVAMMPAIAVMDLRHRIIPNRLMYPALVAFPPLILLAWAVDGSTNPANAGLGFLLYGGGLFLVALVSGGMGMGDVKLAAVIGLVLGSLGLRYVGVAAGAAILLGGVAGVIALALRRGRKSMMPFGPALAAGAVIAAFWGNQIAERYLRTFS